MILKESTVQTGILDYLKARKIFAWPNKSIGVYDQKRKIHRKPTCKHHINGVSDVLGILPDGRFLAIEVKRPYIKGIQSAGELSESQKTFIQCVKNAGGVAFVASSIDDVEKNLD